MGIGRLNLIPSYFILDIPLQLVNTVSVAEHLVYFGVRFALYDEPGRRWHTHIDVIGHFFNVVFAVYDAEELIFDTRTL